MARCVPSDCPVDVGSLAMNTGDERVPRWGFLQAPHLGGTYSVFRSLRPALEAHDISLRWIGVGPSGRIRMEREPGLEGERRWGEVVGAGARDEREQAVALYDHLAGGDYAGVVVNALCGVVETNIVRYLPASLPRLLVVHNITVGTYAAARAVRDYIHHTIGVSPRIRDDLVQRHGFAVDRIRVVANALAAGYECLERIEGRPTNGALRLLSLGRIEDAAKGVLQIPKILRRLDEVDWRFTVAGDGPDRSRLEAACRAFGDRVNFLGGMPADRVPALFQAHDVFVMPSRYEGFGLTLGEAMASGCVPVAARIRGVTDWVVRDGGTGLLFPIDDVAAAADRIRELAADRQRLADLSKAARSEARERFTADRMGAGYAAAMAAASFADAVRPPLPIGRWRAPAGLRSGLRTRLPEPVKIRLRLLRERRSW